VGRSYSWDRVTVPLADFCAAPGRSPDLVLDRVDRLQMGLDRSTGDARLLDRLRAGRREGGAGLIVRRAWARMRRMR
jgi:hypothetical protein